MFTTNCYDAVKRYDMCCLQGGSRLRKIPQHFKTNSSVNNESRKQLLSRLLQLQFTVVTESINPSVVWSLHQQKTFCWSFLLLAFDCCLVTNCNPSSPSAQINNTPWNCILYFGSGSCIVSLSALRRYLPAANERSYWVLEAPPASWHVGILPLDSPNSL